MDDIAPCFSAYFEDDKETYKNDRYHQTMEDMTAHDRRTTFLAIRLYHVIYTVLRTGSWWHGSPTCRKQAVCVKD